MGRQLYESSSTSTIVGHMPHPNTYINAIVEQCVLDQVINKEADLIIHEIDSITYKLMKTKPIAESVPSFKELMDLYESGSGRNTPNPFSD
jgi:hypothetical protein